MRVMACLIASPFPCVGWEGHCNFGSCGAIHGACPRQAELCCDGWGPAFNFGSSGALHHAIMAVHEDDCIWDHVLSDNEYETFGFIDLTLDDDSSNPCTPTLIQEESETDPEEEQHAPIDEEMSIIDTEDCLPPVTPDQIIGEIGRASCRERV